MNSVTEERTINRMIQMNCARSEFINAVKQGNKFDMMKLFNEIYGIACEMAVMIISECEAEKD